MCDTAIQEVVCRAVVSDEYRARLLGSERAVVLRSSDLDAGEQEALLSIRAETIEEFAAGVERMMRLWKQCERRLGTREPIAIREWMAMELPPRTGRG